MSYVNVTINGRQYRMACEEGQERRLLHLADYLENRIVSLRDKFGEVGDARLTIMSALMLADELIDVQQRMAHVEEQLTALQDARFAAGERAKATQTAVSAALNAAAERLERMTQVLNRTVGSGIAIG